MTNSSHSAKNPSNSAPLATDGSAAGAVRLSPALASLFPSGVVVAQLTSPGDPAALFPEETAFVHKAVRKRQEEFAAGRACARRALQELGVANSAILMASDRQPIWPAECTGSITHTSAFCAAVVARRQVVVALGIDTEIVSDVGRELWPTICTDSELRWLLNLPPQSQEQAATLVFCAKEAMYKCQYPLTREWLDFHDLDVAMGEPGLSASGPFVVRARRPIAFERCAPLPITGRYLAHDRYLTAAIAVPQTTAQ